MRLPKFKLQKGKEIGFKSSEESSSDTYTEVEEENESQEEEDESQSSEEEKVNIEINTTLNVEMKEAARKYIQYLFVRKIGKWEDIQNEDIQNLAMAFDIQTQTFKNKLLRIIVKDSRLINSNKLKSQIRKTKFASLDLIGKITDEKISKLVIKYKDEVIPYSLLPVEIFKQNNSYKINGPEYFIKNVIERIVISFEDMDTQISIIEIIPDNLKTHITSVSKLPGKFDFFQKI